MSTESKSVIRPFVPSDIPACAEIIGEVWGIEFARKIIHDFPSSEDYWNERYVADRYGIVVGLCGLYREPQHPENFVGIDWFAVSPRYQKRGIGTALLNEALRRAAGKSVFVWTSKAIPFYLKFGFTVSDLPILPKESETLMVKLQPDNT